MSTIYQAIAEIVGEIGAIEKSKRNQQQGFNYRGIDDFYNNLNPLFAKHGIFSVPEVLSGEREERQNKSGGLLLYSRLRIKYTFYAADGTNVSCIVEGEGMDSGDKASNKAMAVAHKYALMQVFCIPTVEVEDPDAESHQVAPRATQKPSTQKPLQQTPATGAWSDLIIALKEAASEGDEQLYSTWRTNRANMTNHQIIEAQKEMPDVIKRRLEHLTRLKSKSAETTA